MSAINLSRTFRSIFYLIGPKSFEQHLCVHDNKHHKDSLSNNYLLHWSQYSKKERMRLFEGIFKYYVVSFFFPCLHGPEQMLSGSDIVRDFPLLSYKLCVFSCAADSFVSFLSLSNQCFVSFLSAPISILLWEATNCLLFCLV